MESGAALLAALGGGGGKAAVDEFGANCALPVCSPCSFSPVTSAMASQWQAFWAISGGLAGATLTGAMIGVGGAWAGIALATCKPVSSSRWGRTPTVFDELLSCELEPAHQQL